MAIKMKSIFSNKNNKFIIGALHFLPLPGFVGHPGLEKVLEVALADLKAFEVGGVDAVIIENNYDQPHNINVGEETVNAMSFLGREIKKKTKLPIGVSVLWNDYAAALSIAKEIGGTFVRVPVFVDSVITDFGEIIADPEKVIDCRDQLEANSVMIMADVQVKHATMINSKSVSNSVKLANDHGADAIIITGSKTGEPPKIGDLEIAKKASKVPVIIGSGLDSSNASTLLKSADGAIVSTSLKEGSISQEERNAKPYSLRIDVKKVKELMKVAKSLPN
ncbi:MAG: BtpA/SgcQ family protein [Candidatus Micrarchaeota archaeon]|nr:BtpA/SgcQ family protein [Candidatus Micrarchaeota archaeon]